MSHTIDRRRFLGTSGALAGMAMLAGTGTAVAAVRTPAGMASTLIDIGGEFIPGEWRDGGSPVAPVSSVALPNSAFPGKNHGPTRFEEVEVAVPLLRWKSMWSWAQATALGRNPRINAGVAIVDAQGNTIHHLAITNAFATELRFPKVDAASKDFSQLVLKLAGERYQFMPTSRPQVARFAPQQHSLSSSFILQIEGLEKETANTVWAIPPNIVVKDVSSTPGGTRTPETAAAATTVGVLKFSVPFVPGPANALRQWCENSLFAGRQERRGGLLRYLGPSRNPADEIARLGFAELLPYRFEIDQEPGGQLRMNIETSVRSVIIT